MSKKKLFAAGFLMGLANLVPGLSGGTAAFLLGIYEPLMEKLNAFPKELKKKSFWSFFFLLSLGIALGLALFSSALKNILEVPEKRSLLYSLFLGLTLGSIFVCLKRIPQFKKSYGVLLALGAVFPYLIGYAFNGGQGFSLSPFWGGFASFPAMLLPGVSGAYLLKIGGLYSEFVEAIEKFLFLHWEQATLNFLFQMGAGALLGTLLFSKGIAYFLSRFHDQTLVTLSGLILGSLSTLWPFFSYEYAEIGGSVRLMETGLLFPHNLYDFAFAIVLIVLGFYLVKKLETFRLQGS